ncbi:hypothetical protein JS756_11140 [Streptomyces actuosus]|uniref:Uncharacterized protein n=1 Tax=Streptomyces actuosus TaxID=1885 RepID=A0ABS2VNG2_STRAS|nr:hypothetical protein [Streptomyces actuosus]MBN0044652.1 hypothetical protein [Streptomyces actuosus]
MTSSPGQYLLLYFLSSDDRPTPVYRTFPAADGAGTSTPLSGPKGLGLLFIGPRSDETAAGLHTELPRLRGRADTTVTDAGATVTVPFPVRTLSAPAVLQIVCTATYMESDGLAPVTVRGPDGSLPAARCP